MHFELVLIDQHLHLVMLGLSLHDTKGSVEAALVGLLLTLEYNPVQVELVLIDQHLHLMMLELSLYDTKAM